MDSLDPSTLHWWALAAIDQLPTVVEELELLVVDSSSGGQGPSSVADMEGEKESEPEWEQRHKAKGRRPWCNNLS